MRHKLSHSSFRKSVAKRAARASQWIAVGLVSLGMLSSCELRQAMYDTGRIKPYQETSFFDDGRSNRPLEEGTVARGFLRDDAHLYTGKSGGSWARSFPSEIDAKAMARGKENYEIFCSVCHGYTGRGNGMAVQRGFQTPPTFHQTRLRNVEEGYIFDVITNGWGVMPYYRDKLTPAERWEVIAYIRALQLSQWAQTNELPEAVREKVQAAGEGS